MSQPLTPETIKKLRELCPRDECPLTNETLDKIEAFQELKKQ